MECTATSYIKLSQKSEKQEEQLSKVKKYDPKTENSSIIAKCSISIPPENLWFADIFRRY